MIFHPAWDAVLNRDCADDAGVTERGEDGAEGVWGEAGFESDFTKLVWCAVVEALVGHGRLEVGGWGIDYAEATTDKLELECWRLELSIGVLPQAMVIWDALPLWGN